MRTWTTAERPPAEQYPFWREVLCEAFTALDPVADAKGSFESTVAIKDMLDVTISNVASKRQVVYRGMREIRRNPSEFYFANMQLEGSCIVKQDGRETLMRPGDFYIVDTTREYDLVFEDWRILCIRVPRHFLMPLLRAPREVTAVRLSDDGSLGTIAGSFMRSLLDCPEAISLASQQTLIDTFAKLLAISLGATTDVREIGRDSVRQGLRSSIECYVASNLANPELSVGTVAANFRISIRYLHKLFEDKGQSFSQMVLQNRLERCARDLADPNQFDRSITWIAFRWGFNDLSNFCRVFQKRFGMPAGEYRHIRASGQKIILADATLSS